MEFRFLAKNRISELERELRDTRNLANRYRDMSLRGKEKKQPRQQQGDGDVNDEEEGRKITDRDLDDDEAVYKRHVLRVVDMKSMRSTAPIRVQDVIRKNEALFTVLKINTHTSFQILIFFFILGSFGWKRTPSSWSKTTQVRQCTPRQEN